MDLKKVMDATGGEYLVKFRKRIKENHLIPDGSAMSRISVLRNRKDARQARKAAMAQPGSNKSYMDCCDWRLCLGCGECLSKCPVMRMSKAEAAKEIACLIKGERAPGVFSQCTLCNNCNAYCPNGLRPFELILQRVSEQENRKHKVPALMPFMMNSVPGPNFFREYYEKELDHEEKAILKKWSEPPPPSKDVLFVGCLGKMLCKDLENSTVMKDLPKFGPPDICCGEVHYRSGMWNAYADITEKTFARMRTLQAERIVFYCGACRTYLGPVLTEVYGKQLPFKLTTIFEWLLEQYEEGKITVKNPLNYKAAVHDFCNASELGEEFQDNLRKIYAIAGMDIVELKHNRNDTLSCGAASVVREFKPGDLIKAQKVRYKEVRETGAKKIAANCPGCYLIFSGTSRSAGIKPLYMPEQLLRAFGDDIKTPLKSRLFKMGKVALRHPFLAFQKVKPEQVRLLRG